MSKVIIKSYSVIFYGIVFFIFNKKFPKNKKSLDQLDLGLLFIYLLLIYIFLPYPEVIIL